jgi:eukaryotic-like serine/threonine-protein kinase
VADRIGAGGMASVYLGRARGEGGFSRLVAMKIMHDHLAETPELARELREMFLDEARIVGGIHHKNVVDTLDVFEDEGKLHLVMDYVHGPSLAHAIHAVRARADKIPIPIVVAVAIDLLEGLHAAHEAKNERGESRAIVHRDVSPHNVLVGEDGAARVMDFGVASAAARIHQTVSGEVKGKPGYMAPEQARGVDVDRKADVYGAGVVLYEMLVGEIPFDGASFVEIVVRQEAAAAPSPRIARPEVTPALERIVLRALECGPEHRWATARDMAEALEALGIHAPARVVSEWIREEAREFFLQREELVRKLTAHASSPELPIAPATATKTHVDMAHADTVALRPPAPRSRWPSAWLAAPAALTLLAGVAFVALRPGAAAERSPDVAAARDRAATPEPPPVRVGRTVEEVATDLAPLGTVIARSDFGAGAAPVVALADHGYAEASIVDGRLVVQMKKPNAHYGFFVRPEPEGDFILYAKVELRDVPENASALVEWGAGHSWFDLHLHGDGRVVGVVRDGPKTVWRFPGAASTAQAHGPEHVIVVRHRREHVSVWLDGAQVITEVSAPVPTKTVALGADRMSTVAYDDVVLVRLP